MSNTLMTIPLCQLKRSKSNIRKTEPLVDIEQLAASIEANGLLENLIVGQEEKPDVEANGVYEVIAGARRLAALKLLAKRKKIARDHPVPCLVLEKTSAGDLVEVSLAENIVRAPVHPADQFEAFLKLQKEGLPAEDIGARFGLSANVVLQRLKLAAVSPRLMAEYRSDSMSLEQLMAFTISDDHKAQEQVWFEYPFSGISPETIRRLLTKSLVGSGDRRALFIGAKAYEEAGGVVIRDLFQPEDQGYFCDSQLLDKLVAERLERQSDAIKTQGWGWVEIVPETDYTHLGRFGRVKMTEAQLSDEEEARISNLSERYDELVSVIEEDGSDQKTAELDEVTAELDALRAKKEIWPEEEKARAGVLISLDSDGRLHITEGLLRPEDAKASTETARKSATRNAGKEKSANGYSETVLVDLSAHRAAALREVLASQPDRALTALLYALILRIFFGQVETCIEIAPTILDLGKFSPSVGESKAAAALLARHNKWQERLPEKTHLWEWLTAMGQADRLDLLAYCTAVTVDAVHRQWEGAERIKQADLLAQVTGLNMADWWRPTHTAFFDHLTKDQIVKAVMEGASPEASRGIAGRKKNQMGGDAEALLADKRWLPEPLRTVVESKKEATGAAAE